MGLPKIAVLKEVSFKEYSDNIHNKDINYHRQFIVPEEIKTPEDISAFVLENLNNVYNTDIHRYYKVIGIITDTKTEQEESKVNSLIINN